MKKFIYLLLACVVAFVCFTSCKPKYPSSVDYEIMTRLEVRNFLVYTNGLEPSNALRITDEFYAIPTVEWIETHYTTQLQQFLFQYQMRTYKEAENDCDNYSCIGRTVAYIMHRYAKKPRKTSLAVAEFDYKINDFVGHSINLFIARDKQNRKVVVFYEPQMQMRIKINTNNLWVLNISM